MFCFGPVAPLITNIQPIMKDDKREIKEVLGFWTVVSFLLKAKLN